MESSRRLNGTIMEITRISNLNDLPKNLLKINTEVFFSAGDRANGFTCSNIIIGDPPKKDINFLFEPTKNTKFIKFDDSVKWAHILKALGIFSSNGQARKSGWDKDVDMGWSEAVFKKKRHIIFILKAPISPTKNMFRKIINLIKK